MTITAIPRNKQILPLVAGATKLEDLLRNAQNVQILKNSYEAAMIGTLLYIYTSHKKTPFFAISRGSLKIFQI